MVQEIFRGKSVVFTDDGSVKLYMDLFDMIFETAGTTSCLRTDPELNYHLQALRSRLAILTHDGECCEWLVLGLGD